MKSLPTMHEMKLAKAPFERMEQGLKTIEFRLLDEKRQLLKLGDRITFRLYPKLEHACVMQVTALLHYPDFASLIDDMDIAWTGYDEKDRDWLKAGMNEIYPAEEQQEYPALGIRLKKVQD